MALWGITDADEAKPKWLTDAQKKEVFANNSGWVVEGGSIQTGNGNADAQPEVLCCIGQLATGIGAADITQIEFITTAFDKSDGGNIDVRVRFNEAVTVNTSGGTPTLAITNGNQGTGSGRGPHSAAFLSGSGSNELVFRVTIAAGNAATNADDVLVIGANPLALNSGTIKDTADGSTNATITSSADIGTAAGSITVTA
tara:strand:+ start:74 stop:670 length:597 start_codon:yes stop_codon:yes gene_type:complete